MADFGREYAEVADLRVEAAGGRVVIDGHWGEESFRMWGDTAEEVFTRLAERATQKPDPRPNEDGNVYRCEGDEPFQRCVHCGELPNADHHEIIGEFVVKCRWDEINDFDLFDDSGRAVACPSCGGHVKDEPASVDGLANVTCDDCGEEFYRESYPDLGRTGAGKQLLKNEDYEVVARVL